MLERAVFSTAVDALHIGGNQTPQAAADQAHIQGEQLAAHNVRSGQAGAGEVVHGAAQSPGALPAEVIMASTRCPAGVLKEAPSDSTSAGRFLLAARSVRGNDTRTTCQRS